MINYVYRGLIERGAHYEWREGYSESVDGKVLYPWNTKRECQQEAKARGARASFVTPCPKGRAVCPDCEGDGRSWDDEGNLDGGECETCGGNGDLPPEEEESDVHHEQA